MMAFESKPFKVWSCDRQIKKAVVVSSFDELKEKGCQKLSYDNVPELVVVLESDGTEVEDDLYFNTLEKGTVFLLLQPGEKWFPPRVELYSRGDSYGIQICDVASAVQGRPNVTAVSKAPIVTRLEKLTPSKSTLSPRSGRPIEKITPTTYVPQFHSYESSSDDEFFVEPPKVDIIEAPVSVNYSYFEGETQPATRPRPTNFIHARSILKPTDRTNRLVREIEDAIASDNISSDLPSKAVLAATRRTKHPIRPYDDRAYWSHSATQCLIQSYQCYKGHFNQPRGQLKSIWRLVANKMQCYGFRASATACDKKWRNLKMTYKAIIKKMSLGSIRTRKSWQYFGSMREAMKEPIESVCCREGDLDCDWLAEFVHQKKEQEIEDLEEIRRVSHHTVEQLRKENESLNLLNDYLTSCVTKLGRE